MSLNSLTPEARSNDARRSSIALGLLVVATLALYWPLTTHPTDLMVGSHESGWNDLTTVFLRYRETPRFLREQHAEWSDWDSHLALGMPVHGNPQMALGYPPNWLSFLFGAELTLSWLMIAHLFWSGVGCWLLSRRWGVGHLASLFSGLVAVGAPYCVAHMAEGHVAQIFTVAWIPWGLWAFDRFLESDGRKWRAVTIIFAMSFLAGHVQEIYYLALLLTGTLIVQAGQAWLRGERLRAGRLIAFWLLAGGLTGAVVAFDLLPIWLNLKECLRGQTLPLATAGDGLKSAHLRQLWNPFALGGPAEIDRVRYGFYWCKLCHFGVIPLLLAAVGLITSWRRAATQRLFWQIAVAFAFAFGAMTPLFKLCYRFVPLIDSFRMPARMLFICSFGVAILAGLGLNRLIARRQVPEDNGTTDSSNPSDPPLQTEPQRQLSISGRGFAVALLALGASGYELGRHANRVLAFVPRESLRRNSELSQFLRSHAAEGRVLVSQQLYSDLEALRDGVRRVRGYEPVAQSRFIPILDALLNVPDERLDFAGFEELRLDSIHQPVADLLGIKYVVTSLKQPPPSGWKLIATGKVPALVTPRGHEVRVTRFGIYENPTPLPRAFVVGNATVLSETSLKRRADALEQLDPRASVLLDRDVLRAEPRASLMPAILESDRGNHVRVRTSASLPGYLVLTELFHPGWQATVDGQSSEVLVANLGLRAVAVPAGEHTVDFHFVVPGRRIGSLVSLIAIVALVTDAVLRQLVSRKNSSPQ